MKLASLAGGGRDGTLVVVDDALERAVAVAAIAPTLQRALDDWTRAEPALRAVAADLAAGRCADAFALDVSALASPLPRAYQFLDGSVYLHHMEKARRARGAAMPANHDTEPLMYQGVSDGFCAPHGAMHLPSEDLDIDFEAEIAIVTDDVPMGVDVGAAASHVKLVMLMNDFTCRALTRSELPKGFGFVQSKPTSAFSPVAVTPDALGAAWDGALLHGRLQSFVNARAVGCPDAGVDAFFGYPRLIAHAARTRALGAGTIIAAGAVSNRDPASGHGCLAEARFDDEQAGRTLTPWLCFGDVVRIEMCDAAGRSIFGALENRIAGPA
ncbi:MAG: fumarylacetoacetate hydrolase family protein [Gammaproteobacteria bacterium]|nr:fumarylacetoacetate hydrolase family protein [Gammaproteobacteria bacterium]MCP5200965.1 fumarylacetoacetate hydrolase family protein [Gammaproteobacteria bacterium]